MILRDVVDRFESKSPICVMAKAAMENVLSAERLDLMFENTAEQQANKQLMFSAVVDSMGWSLAKSNRRCMPRSEETRFSLWFQVGFVEHSGQRSVSASRLTWCVFGAARAPRRHSPRISVIIPLPMSVACIKPVKRWVAAAGP